MMIVSILLFAALLFAALLFAVMILSRSSCRLGLLNFVLSLSLSLGLMMLQWFMSIFTTHAYSSTILPQYEWSIIINLKKNEYDENKEMRERDGWGRTKDILI